MRCSFPNLCVFYQETESNNSKRPICLLQDFEINYKNLSKIENCHNHKTFKELNRNWKNILDIPMTKV